MNHQNPLGTISVSAFLLFFLGSVAAAADTGQATSAPFKLKNSHATLLIDAEGRVKLEPNDAACPAPAPFRSPLWLITVAEGADPFRPGKTITTREADAPEVTRTDRGVRLFYDGIRHGDETFAIQLDLTIEVAGDEFRFGGKIVNNTKTRIVTEWKYPILLGIEAKDPAAQTAAPALLWPEGLGLRFPTPETFGRTRSFDYPSYKGSMQWVAFTHGDAGLYFGSHDENGSSKTFAAAHTDGAGYDVSLKLFPYCAPGGEWQGPPAVLMPYARPWYAAARHYREWVESWIDPLPTPQWTRDSTGWLLAILKQQNGDLMWPYETLDRLADLAEERGLDTLGLFGWAHGGHDRYYPDYIPDPKMGGPEVLKKAIARVRERGLNVIIYANGQLIDSATEFYRLQGVETMIVDQRQKPTIEMYNKFKSTSTPLFVSACMAAPRWQERMLSLARQAHDLGANGILFDQLGVVGPRQCFNRDHGHETPAGSCAEGRFELIRGIARPMRSLDPEFVFMTEGVVDIEQADIPYFHGCGTGFGYYEPGKSETVFPELFRYTFPEFVATQRIPNPFLTRNFANYACAFGLRFEIESRYTADVKFLTTDETPAPEEYADCNSPPDVALLQTVSRDDTTRYTRAVADLRRQHADLLLRGRFIDEEGVTVEGEGVVGKAFQSGDRIGVILWNPGDQSRPVGVAVAGHVFSAAYAPGEAEAVEREAAIPAESIRLLVWEKR